MSNTDIFKFALLLGDVAPSIESFDGRLFLDRAGDGLELLAKRISQYSNAREAQRWINLVPIDDFIDCAVSDWSMDDPSLEAIVDIYRRSWLALVRARYGDIPGISVELLTDEEYGDVMLRLNQR
ncbi:MAG TPA: hypothetical protein VHW25_01880 [Steroidobacteraceae bacterium]|jgi:hypothetical protein|nr:hypothetical protein [Steroidobacteraceae bacterium]